MAVSLAESNHWTKGWGGAEEGGIQSRMLEGRELTSCVQGALGLGEHAIG